PDYLALVGDAADGYPGIAGIGPKTAAQLIGLYGPLEAFPSERLKDRDQALLFKRLATLNADAPPFSDVEQLRLRAATPEFPTIADEAGDAKLTARVKALEEGLAQ